MYPQINQIRRPVPGLASIIGGYDWIQLNPRKQVGGVSVFQAFEKGRWRGRIDLVIDPADKKASLARDSYLPVTAAIAPDPEVQAQVESYHQKLDPEFKEVIGEAVVFLDAERERVRYEETNLGVLASR